MNTFIQKSFKKWAWGKWLLGAALLLASSLSGATLTFTINGIGSGTPAFINVPGGLSQAFDPTINDLVNGSPAANSAGLTFVLSGGSSNGYATGVDGTQHKIYVNVATPQGGNYVQYRICELALPTNCSPFGLAYYFVSGLSAPVGGTLNLPAGGGLLTMAIGDGLTYQNSGVSVYYNYPKNSSIIVSQSPGLNLTPLAGSPNFLVPSGLLPGAYTVVYKNTADQGFYPGIVDSANGTWTINIAAGPAAVADSVTVPATGGVVNVLGNDTFSGAPATVANVTATVGETTLAGATFNAAGQLVLPAAAAGNYLVAYQICDRGNLTLCSGYTPVNVLYVAGTGVIAAADTANLVVGTAATVDVLANDTLNGAAATSSNVSVQIVNNVGISALAINAAGQLVVPALTLGSYAPSYKLCSVATPALCSAVATVNLNVAAAAVPVAAPTGSGFALKADGITMPLTGGTLNVLANDRYNGAVIAPGSVTLVLTSRGAVTNASISSNGLLYIPPGLLPAAYLLEYQACLAAAPTTCAKAQVNILVSASVTTATRKAPSVPGALQAVTSVITTGVSPLSFGTGGPTPPGSINDPLVFTGIRIGFGDSVGGPSFTRVTESQDLPTFNAMLFYAGAGQLRARWEVIQPGDLDPSDLDLVPEDGLTVLQLAQRHAYTLVERATGYLSPTGSYVLRGPDARRLPRSRLGTYRILLRLESTGSARAGLFYIPFLTYRVESDPIVASSSSGSERNSQSDAQADSQSDPLGGSGGASGRVRKRFTANTDVADFSKVGELDIGRTLLDGGGLKIGNFEKKPAAVGFESVGSKQPSAGQQLSAVQPIKLEWEDAKSATVDYWHVEIRTETNVLLTVTRVVKRTDYTLARPLVAGLPRNANLRWRVLGTDKEGHVTASSAWLFFSVVN